MCIVCEHDPLKCPTCLCADDIDVVECEWRYYCSKCKTYWYASADYSKLVKDKPNG